MCRVGSRMSFPSGTSMFAPEDCYPNRNVLKVKGAGLLSTGGLKS